MKCKKSVERQNFMKRNKSNNRKAHVNDQIDDKSHDKSWFFIRSIFYLAVLMQLTSLGLAIYSIFK